MNEAFDELAELVGLALAERWLNERRARPKGQGPESSAGPSRRRKCDKPPDHSVPPQDPLQAEQNHDGQRADKTP